MYLLLFYFIILVYSITNFYIFVIKNILFYLRLYYETFILALFVYYYNCFILFLNNLFIFILDIINIQPSYVFMQCLCIHILYLFPNGFLMAIWRNTAFIIFTIYSTSQYHQLLLCFSQRVFGEGAMLVCFCSIFISYIICFIFFLFSLCLLLSPCIRILYSVYTTFSYFICAIVWYGNSHIIYVIHLLLFYFFITY